MPVTFEWWNDEKTVMAYSVTGNDWNWTDVHRAVHLSLFQLVNVDHPVHTLADFRQATKWAGGAMAHLRSLGKKREHTHFSGKAILLGVPDDLRVKVTGDLTRFDFITAEQAIHFVSDEDDVVDYL
jgi:hypothetical protein